MTRNMKQAIRCPPPLSFRQHQRSMRVGEWCWPFPFLLWCCCVMHLEGRRVELDGQASVWLVWEWVATTVGGRELRSLLRTGAACEAV